jgi:hypothetical protein
MWDWDDLSTDTFLQTFDVDARVRARERRPADVEAPRSVPPKLGSAKVRRHGADQKMRAMSNSVQAMVARLGGEPDVQ